MNPFDWPGPPFLVFYAALAVGVLAINYALRQVRESAPEVPRLDDPYLIACLRGGKSEVVRAAIFHLINEQQLTRNDNTITGARSASAALHKEPVEKAVLDIGKLGTTKALEVVNRVTRLPEMNAYVQRVEAAGLAPNPAQRRQRWMWAALFAGFLLLVTYTKITLAFSRGKSNVSFLVILTIIALVGLLVQSLKRRTAAGDRVLSDLRNLFAETRAQEHLPVPREALLVAAVFGLGAVTASGYPFVPSLFPRAGTGSSSGCGSSCGSSGCGGGGCGGCGGGD